MLTIEKTPDGKLRFEGQADLSPQETVFLNTVLNIFKESAPTTTPMILTFTPDPPQRVTLPSRVAASPAVPTRAAVAPDLSDLHGTQTLPCANCGKPKRQSAWQVKRNNGKVFCCRACFWSFNKRGRA